MLLQYQLPALTGLILLLCRAAPGESASRRRGNTRQQHNFFYEEYKGVLKAANMTAFPDGDIRNLFIKSHEWTQNRKQQQSENAKPEISSASENQSPVSQTSAASRRQRKKSGRKGRGRRFKKVTKAHLPATNIFWRKLPFGTREKPELQESNELDTQSVQIQSTITNSRRASRKDRRKNRKNRQRPPSAKPIQGQTTLSLSIARLKQRCKTKPMKQEIKVQGCMSKSIMNNFCYGQCNSFYIPEVRGKGNGPPTFTSCGFCRPRTVRPIYVTLRCTNRRGHIRWKRKKVPYVKKCRCMEQEIKLDPL